jgi:hypothetical protein
MVNINKQFLSARNNKFWNSLFWIIRNSSYFGHNNWFIHEEIYQDAWQVMERNLESARIIKQFLDKLNNNTTEKEVLETLAKSIFLLPSDYSRPSPRSAWKSPLPEDLLFILDESTPSNFRLESKSQPERVLSLHNEFRLASREEESTLWGEEVYASGILPNNKRIVHKLSNYGILVVRKVEEDNQDTKFRLVSNPLPQYPGRFVRKVENWDSPVREIKDDDIISEDLKMLKSKVIVAYEFSPETRKDNGSQQSETQIETLQKQLETKQAEVNWLQEQLKNYIGNEGYEALIEVNYPPQFRNNQ